MWKSCRFSYKKLFNLSFDLLLALTDTCLCKMSSLFPRRSISSKVACQLWCWACTSCSWLSSPTGVPLHDSRISLLVEVKLLSLVTANPSVARILSVGWQSRDLQVSITLLGAWEVISVLPALSYSSPRLQIKEEPKPLQIPSFSGPEIIPIRQHRCTNVSLLPGLLIKQIRPTPPTPAQSFRPGLGPLIQESLASHYSWNQAEPETLH